jgi:selenide, water dikinase
MKRLVLAGGGHAHVEVLRRFALARPAGTEIVLVTPSAQTPYSGMLPGHVAGFYAREEMFIDVARLAEACGARFVVARVAALDAAAGGMQLDDGTRMAYDFVSLDVGSTPATAGADGVAQHALAVKPIEAFLAGWAALLLRIADGSVRRVAVVGAGAAGVEMLLAMRHRAHATANGAAVEWQLVTDAVDILAGFPEGVRRRFLRVLAARGVIVHRQSPVARVDGEGVRTTSGILVPADAVIWATGAAAPAWLADSRLVLDQAGFVAVDGTLRASSHRNVFAAGDAATMTAHPRPKSGVYAVRQGPVLARNLAASLADSPLERYVPQRDALALITTGDRHAVATRGGWSLAGEWVWRWKDRIDRRFMARYRA